MICRIVAITVQARRRFLVAVRTSYVTENMLFIADAERGPLRYVLQLSKLKTTTTTTSSTRRSYYESRRSFGRVLRDEGLRINIIYVYASYSRETINQKNIKAHRITKEILEQAAIRPCINLVRANVYAVPIRLLLLRKLRPMVVYKWISCGRIQEDKKLLIHFPGDFVLDFEVEASNHRSEDKKVE
uniref:Uncharacterized protein n=1 Tax=Trichogramma kaykai TaxID=54128 RepID=A0ABD2X828_9HYME